MVVQHNLTAMNSNRMLGITTGTQAKSTEKLSSGYKINRAADDAAGLSISEKMRKQIRGLTQASLNAEDGISAVQTAEGALNEVQDMLQRMNELAVKAANGTMSENDRSYIQNEIDQLITEIDRVAETTKFNETYLLKGDRNADKVATFSYAEAMTVEFGEDVDVLYAADGTEFKNAEALEEYLLANPNAKIYKSPASAVAGESNQGVQNVKIKENATGLPTTATTYTYSEAAGGWTAAAVPTNANVPVMAAAETVDISGMFELDATPADGDTFTYTPAEEAVEGTDYTVTTPRGNTGNKEIGSLKDTDKTEDVEDGNDDGNGNEEVTYSALNDDTIKNILKGAEGAPETVYIKNGDQYDEVTELTDYVSIVDASLKNGETPVSFDDYASYKATSDGVAFDSKQAFIDHIGSESGNKTVYNASDSGEVTLTYTAESLDYAEKAGDAGDYAASDFYIVNEAGNEPASLAQTPMLATNMTIADNQMDGTTPIDISGVSANETLTIGDKTYTKVAATPDAANGEYSNLTELKALALEDGYVIEGDAETAITIKEKEADAPTYTEDAVYYDADGNRISANALGNYIEYNEEEGSVKFKADARPIYTDKEGKNAVTNDMLKDDIVVAKDDLVGALELKLHVGADATSNNQISVKLDAMSAKGLGVENMKVDGADDKNALDAIETIREAIQKVSTQRSALGAVQNRLEHTIANLDNVVENTTAAESQIRDTDMATEMVKYSNNNILAQAGQAMLAQANQANQGVLSLLG